ncbi:hypothetical protein SRHO_G00237580 [Serrasalmus rhombeus]
MTQWVDDNEAGTDSGRGLRVSGQRVGPVIGHWPSGGFGMCPGVSSNLSATVHPPRVERPRRSRRGNIRIYRVPEGSEESFPYVTDFLEHLLKSTLDLDPSLELHIERAHRALAPKPPESAKPRSIVARFLSYKTKEAVIKQAWARKRVDWQGNRILFDHDYSPDVLQRRRALQEAKKVLKENDVKFQTRFPAKLRVFYSDGTRVYSSAEEAERDMAERGFSITATQSPATLMERIQRLSWRKTGNSRRGATICEL